jgi:sugar lactone lactonase YvrE
LEGRTLLSLNPTSISVTASTSQVVYGQPVTFTATVTEVAPGGATPTGGTVTFYDGSPYDGSTAIGTVPLNEGLATLTTTSLYGGPSMISAIYSGDGQNFAGSGFGTFTTVAGNGTSGYSGDKGLATSAELRGASGVAVDAQGDVFIADSASNVIREVTPDGFITTVAGNGTAGSSGDGGQATAAALNSPRDVAVDDQGNLFIADFNNNVVRKVTPGPDGLLSDGTISTVAIRDGLTNPISVAVDAQGDLFVSDARGVRELMPDGVVTGIGGCFSCGVAVDTHGNPFLADWFSNVVREVTPGGFLTTVAGDGTAGYSGDGGPATHAELSLPFNVAVDAQGDLFIADQGGGLVREVTSGGVITTIAGDGGVTTSESEVTAAAPADPFRLPGAGGLTVNGQGDLLIAEGTVVERVVPGLAINVTTAPAVTTITASSNAPVYSQPVTFTATVTAQSPGLTPTQFSGLGGSIGSIQWMIDGANVASRETVFSSDAAPSATLSVSSQEGLLLGAGEHTISAVFTPSFPNLSASSGSFPGGFNVSAEGSTTTVTATSDTSVYGQPVTFTATEAPQAPGTVVPAGMVQFMVDGADVGTPESTGGTASLTLTSLGLGAHTVSAVYTSDSADFLGSTGTLPDNVDVSSATSSTTVGASSSPAVYGQPATLTATVTAQDPSMATPTGSVQFVIDGSNVNAPLNLDDTGTATLTLTSLGLGAHGVSAVYTSDSTDFTGSRGVLTGGEIIEIPTTTSVSASSATLAFGQAETFTATVTPQVLGISQPTGTVQFEVGGVDYNAPLAAGSGGTGIASITLSTLALGYHDVSAVFSSDSINFTGSSSPTHATTTVGAFGDGPYQFSGDGGPATAAVLSNPQGVAIDTHGDLFIADADDKVVRKVSASGIITTVAGDGTPGYSGDGGQAIAATLNGPTAVALDGNGDLFIADTGNNVIREVKPGPNGLLSLGTISTIAGGGTNFDPAFSGSATDAALSAPSGLAVDNSGNLYIADTGNNIVREVVGSAMTTIAGNGTADYSGDTQAATSTGLNGPTGLAVDGSGDLFIADTGNNVVREVTSGTITTIAGGGANSEPAFSGSPKDAALYGPAGLAVDNAGNLYIADTGNAIVRELTSGTITTIAGNGTAGYSQDTHATSTELDGPAGLAISANGLFIADAANNLVREVASGTINTVAGNTAKSAVAPWGHPTGVAVHAQGDVFVADALGNVVYEVSPTGVITIVASNLNDPTGLAVDAEGDLFIADAGNDVVREVTPGSDGRLADGTMTIIAGNGTRGDSGDGAAAKLAELDLDSDRNATSSLAVDVHGDLFIADSYNNAVREVTPGSDGLLSDGTINTVISFGAQTGGSGNPGVPSSQEDLQGIAADAQGDLYFAVSFSGPTGVVYELEPNGDTPSIGPPYYDPTGVAVDARGDVFVADSGVPGDGSFGGAWGNGIIETPSNADNASTLIAFYPHQRGRLDVHWLAVDAQGDLFYDMGGSVVRIAGGSITVSVSAAATATTVSTSSVTSVAGQAVTFTATVTPRAPGGGTPTGTVTFLDGTTVLATEVLSGGSTSFATTSLAVGPHTITAVYSGDADFVTSISATLTQQVDDLNPTNLQSVISAAQSSGGTVTLSTPTTGTLTTTLNVIASLPASSTGAVSVDLGNNATYVQYDGNGNVIPIAASAPAGVTITISCPSGSATVYDLQPSGGNIDVHGVPGQGNITIVGNSPALTVRGGNVTIGPGVTLITATNSPTILVTGGTLTLRGAVVQESTAFSQAAIVITGGTLDLGTTARLGGNTFNVNGTGTLIENTTGSAIPAVGDTFENNGTAIGSNFGGVSLSAPGSQTANQGVPQLFSLGALSDTVKDSQSWAVDVNWGDGSADTGFHAPSTGPLSAQSHAFALPGTYTVTVTATDPVASGVVAWDFVQTFTVSVAPSLFVLNPTAQGALTLSANASVKIPGAVVVDSSSSSALLAGGNAAITASVIDVLGGLQKTSNATINPAPTTGVSIADPLAALAAPSTAGLNNYGPVSFTTGSHTINPGIYTEIKVSGNASLTMSAGTGGTPGIYLIEGGGLTVTGNASISGHNVLIYNTGSNYPSSGGNFGGITLSGNGTFNLSAPTLGTYAGVVIFQSRANTRALSFGGNAMNGISGVIYAPNALLSFSGNSQLQAALDVGMLNLSGNVALTQTAAGSDGSGDTSGIANTLLAGDLSVYINDPSGLFTSDELARIQEAVNAWDAILAPYNVTITEVSNPTLANMVIDTSTTSACGGRSSGVLGCFNAPNNEITLIQGWNWYPGSDPTQIGAGQYDFETTVLHELGHALGLGGSTNTSSPMYQTLAAGAALRTVTTQDLNIPDPPEGADPQRAAGFNFVASTDFSAPNGTADALGSTSTPSAVGLIPLPPAAGTSTPLSTGFPPRPLAWSFSRPVVNSPEAREHLAVLQESDQEGVDGPARSKARSDRLTAPVLDELAADLVFSQRLTRLWDDGKPSVGGREGSGAPFRARGSVPATRHTQPAAYSSAGSQSPRSALENGTSPGMGLAPVRQILAGELPAQEDDAPRRPDRATARLVDLLLAAGLCGYGAGLVAARTRKTQSPFPSKTSCKLL